MHSGHAVVEIDSSSKRIISRRINLRCDIADMMEDILPHEVTHVVFGQYYQWPSWANEAVAVLSESQDKIDRYRRYLSKLNKEGSTFGLKELMQMRTYPAQSRTHVFYAQSALLVDFLTKERGAKVFIAFMGDGLRDGYDAALLSHYKMDFADLEKNWQKFLAKE
jgi:hypothetical protein